MKREVIIACDFSSKEEVLNFLEQFKDKKPFLKIGMELFYKEGSSFVQYLKEEGYPIFLDLKLHDIPNTVQKAMKNIGDLKVDITNVHAAGGIEMMKAAKAGLLASAGAQTTKLIAVTQLTSISEDILKKELLIDRPLPSVVKSYAQNVKEAGLDGVVCSALEAEMMQEFHFLVVTPGIRFATDAKQDQKRVATPELAKSLGSTHIVVGRSITKALNPVEAYLKCVKEFC